MGRRDEVLAVLRDGPRTLAEIASAIGIHPNTARFHLDALMSEELISAVPGTSSGRGRPPTTYALRPVMARGGLREYRLLAEMLLGTVTPRRAEKIGESWGHHLVERPAPGQQVDATGRVVELLDRIGFAPEPVVDGIRLRHCPFLELAEHNREVVCPMHLGLIRGALAELGSPVTAERLVPFAEGNACRAYLR
ncbi:ArsR family transcriptional regulator [Lentzea sp. NBRC 105346]|uniref:helix-turn-helix transcriptional regulator n=1 Tax=Lentzea sp. NBRC 105346 TaxID=3032205 RepID=UPI0024A48D36|nr:helix-turn-helix domain-containing protein [Lentzea sp. NBRC 105346]GLZ28721.1 ArsR family transcriptional regulator [Lentzea sp. NBRC 105346]